MGPSLNWQLIVPVVAGAVLAVGAGMAVCAAIALGDAGSSPGAFALPAAIAIPAGVLGVLSGRRLKGTPLRARDGFFAVTAAWVVAALVGAVPFLLDGAIDRPVHALFESMSGFTTTGATAIADVDSQPDAILMWRSLMQWLGGVGIVLLVVAIAPATGLASQRVFYAETSGITTDRLTPRIADTAKIILAIYLTLTTLGFAAYWIAGMSPWEAINHIFTTISTGGFSTRTDSIAAFDSTAIEVVAIVFMIAAGINFAFYWLALRGRDRIWPQAAEVRALLIILAVGISAATLSLVALDDLELGDSLRGAAFTVVSLTTGTGYTTVNFDAWNDFARLGLLTLMFFGACAGSTSGGMKVIRVMLLGKTAGQEIQRQLQPKAVQVLRVRGRVYAEEVRRGVLGFFYIYMVVFVAGTLAMAAFGLDPVSAASSTVATLNIVGPGLGEVGATQHYGTVPDGGLGVMTALMLAGRLEIFAVLVLLTRAFWRRGTA